jgi:tetraacyldisaccharide 4'-kinase
MTAGGTGKTPLVEYLIRLLSANCRVGVLSRGYKRESSGYQLANEKSTSPDIGDEMYQMKLKYPEAVMAVDGDRRRGIKNLLAMPEDVRPQVILLDDAFQHRYVHPSLSIGGTEIHHLYYNDTLLPAGRLREPVSAIRRAGIVIVSKCDLSLKPIDSRIIENEMQLKPFQPLFFTGISYQPLKGIYPNECKHCTLNDIRKDDALILLTGIANPSPLIEEMKKYSDNVKVMSFADHHAFTKSDVHEINEELSKLNAKNQMIICTEKDAARIRNNPYFPDKWRAFLYYVPIAIHFLYEKGNLFDELITKHITTFENSSILR